MRLGLTGIGAGLLAGAAWLSGGCEAKAVACGGSMIIDDQDLDDDGDTYECVHEDCESADSVPDCVDGEEHYEAGCVCVPDAPVACGGSLIIDEQDLDDDGDTYECVHEDCQSAAKVPDCVEGEEHYEAGCVCVPDAQEGEAESESESESESEGEPFFDVYWTINGLGPEGVSYDNCEDIEENLLMILDVFQNDKPLTKKSLAVACADYAAAIDWSPPGMYEILGQLQTCDDPPDCTTGEAVTDGLRYEVELGDEGPTVVEIDFAIEDFLYTDPLLGTYLFSTTWAGDECNDATPAVNQEIALLEMDGTLVAGAEVCIEDGVTLCEGDTQCAAADGTAVHCCYDSDVDQTIADLEWGNYMLRVSGDDFLANICFEEDFAIFVGAGDNPGETLDVAPTDDPDCGG